MSNAEARLELLTRINRAISGLTAPTLPPYPRSAPLAYAERIHQFEDRILDYKAAFVRVSAAEVREVVAQALAGAKRVIAPYGLPQAYLPPHLEWLSDQPPLSHAELDKAQAVVTTCAAAISETGTIILDHAEGQGRRALTLIPDRHVCIIRADQVVSSVWEGVQAVRASVHAGQPLTWISGPSATSDIELVRVEGVHGPRQLSVIVVEEPTKNP